MSLSKKANECAQYEVIGCSVQRRNGSAAESSMRCPRNTVRRSSAIRLPRRSCEKRGTEAIESIRVLFEISGAKDNEHINLKPFNGEYTE
jgi:hypothetical protein